MRKSRAKKRILMPDPKFGSVLVTRFVNNLMLDGKKSIAFKVFYDALDLISSKIESTNQEYLIVRSCYQSFIAYLKNISINKIISTASIIT